MTHECKLCKSDEMRDLLVDGNGIFFCRSCGKAVDDLDVHPEAFPKREEILKKKRIFRI